MIELIVVLHISFVQPSIEQKKWEEYNQALLQMHRQELIDFNEGKEIWRQEQAAERKHYHQPDQFERRFYP
jgi:hypothetical protein